MGRGYHIEYQGKVYNKKELFKEFNITTAIWDRAVRILHRAIREEGIDIDIISDEDYINAIMDTIKSLQKNDTAYTERVNELQKAKEAKLDKPVHIKNHVFYTFIDIENFIGHENFNYNDYYSFKSSRKTVYSVEDFISYLYTTDESFKLRFLYVTDTISKSLYQLASRCLNEYAIVRKGFRNVPRGRKLLVTDNKTMCFRITADDAIKIAYGKMNYDSSTHQITSMLTNRWNYYPGKDKNINNN